MLKFAIAILFLVFPLGSQASGPSDDLRSILSRYDSFHAGFLQKTYSSSGRLMTSSKGSLWLKRPNFFRWEVSTPSRQTVVCDGKFVWIYNVDLMQVTKQPFSSRGETPVSILVNGGRLLSKNFIVSKKNLGKVSEFELKSKSPDSTFLNVAFSFKGGVLVGMAFKNNLDQVSTYSFNQSVINPSVAPSMFQFLVPKGVDVVVNPAG